MLFPGGILGFRSVVVGSLVEVPGLVTLKTLRPKNSSQSRGSKIPTR